MQIIKKLIKSKIFRQLKSNFFFLVLYKKKTNKKQKRFLLSNFDLLKSNDF